MRSETHLLGARQSKANKMSCYYVSLWSDKTEGLQSIHISVALELVGKS